MDGEKPLLAKSMTGASKLVEDADSMAPRTPTSTLPQPAPKRRSVWVWVGAILGLALLGGLIAGLVVGLQGRAATPSVSSTTVSSGAPLSNSADWMTLYISAERKDCTGMMPMKCLQIKTALDKPYTLFYGTIRNFTYEEGFAYTLRVSRTEVKNPPADGSSFYYTCLEVVDKVPLAQELPIFPPFQDTEWTLVAFPASGREIVQGPRGRPTFSVSAGRMSGLASVNRFSATITVVDSTLTVGPIAVTRMMGPENLMQQEAAYVDALANVTGFRIVLSDGAPRLELLNAQGAALIAFSPPRSRIDTLLGTSWVLKEINGAAPIPRAPTIEFSAEEPIRVSGFSSVNRYSGSAEISGIQLSFSKNLVSTMMAGAPEAMKQEAAFITALTSVNGYDIKSVRGVEELSMTDNEGVVVLRWTQVVKA